MRIPKHLSTLLIAGSVAANASNSSANTTSGIEKAKIQEHTAHTMKNTLDIHNHDKHVLDTVQSIASQNIDTAQKNLDFLLDKNQLDIQTHTIYKEIITHADSDTITQHIEDIHSQLQQKEAGSENSKDHNTLVMILSILALAWFSRMIVDSIKGKHISFIKHHGVFAAIAAVMATQIPHDIAHGLVESVVATLAILGISRLARGIYIKTDLSQLSDEEAKHVLWALGPLASIITTPAAATIFADLGKKLTHDKDKYQAMQSIGNVDGALFIGDFPFLYNWMQNGIGKGILWQGKIMLPILIFHKIFQAISRKISPASVWKHRTIITEIVKNFRFSGKRLGEKEHIESEETQVIREFCLYLRERITQEPSLSTQEKSIILEEITHHEPQTQEESDLNIDAEKHKEEFIASVEETLTQDNIQKVIEALRKGIENGTITQQDLQDFTQGKHIEHLVEKTGIAHIFAHGDALLNQKFNKLMKSVKGNENEKEVAKVFTAQALAVCVMMPIIGVIFEKMGTVPGTLQSAVGMMSSVADNYAATVAARSTDAARGIAFAILGGALTKFGNMANINFLGNNADFGTSLKMAKYMIPTMLFAFAWTTRGGSGDKQTKATEESKIYVSKTTPKKPSPGEVYRYNPSQK